MLCEVCNKNIAEKKLNKSIGGNLRTIYLCKECFNRGCERIAQQVRKCPNCGRTIEEINATLLVGCANCYSFFKEDLQPVIRKVQQL